MGLRNKIFKIWKDPVWSNVIAFGIISLITAFYLSVDPYIKGLNIYVKIGLIIGIAILFGVIFLIIWFLRNRSNSKLIIYLSAGGVGRDPMAKAITQKLLENIDLGFKIKINGMALIEASSNEVEYAARHAIIKIFEEDVISDHIPEVISKEILKKADLVLVMDKGLLNLFQHKFENYNNVFVFKEFFGLHGDIEDPFPDGKDENTLNRYEKTALEMKDIISNNIEKLINAIKC